MTDNSNGNVVQRREYASVWMFFVGALVVHAIIIVGLSPSLYMEGKDKSPEGLLEHARKLAEEGKYEESLETYKLLAAQKPQIPVVFEKGEKEMQKVRLQMLQKQREDAEASEKGEETSGDGEEGADTPAEDGADNGEQPDGDDAQETTDEPPTEPDDMPQLPGLD